MLFATPEEVRIMPQIYVLDVAPTALHILPMNQNIRNK